MIATIFGYHVNRETEQPEPGETGKESAYSYGFFGGLIYAANKIVTIVCDNASNNDTMIKELDLEGFRGTGGRIQCFPHILNLSVKVLWHHLIYDPFLLLTLHEGYSFPVCKQVG